MQPENSPDPSGAYFSAENLQKKRASITVSLSLRLAQGEMAVIVGASGSGKSTALRLIAGLEPPDKSGLPEPRIVIDGKDITRLPPGRRGVGMVFQSPALFMHYNVRDNIAYGLAAKGLKKKAARLQAENFLEKINLQGFGDRFPETLSGGEAQRVALARTLITAPKIILFDEPLSALDSKLRLQLADEIRALQRQNKFTGLWVTHDLAEAERLADRIITLESGKIISDTEKTP